MAAADGDRSAAEGSCGDASGCSGGARARLGRSNRRKQRRIAPEPDKPTLEPKPKAEKSVKKPVEKKEPPKKAKPSAGSGGENKQDSKRDPSRGPRQQRRTKIRVAPAAAAVWGAQPLPTTPAKCSRRSAAPSEVPSQYKRMSASMSVRVRLTIGASGDLSGLSIARSSGIPELDQAVVEGIRRAAPFPPLPTEWGKPVWSFNQDVQVTGR